MSSDKVSIIIPAYNEAQSIGDVIHKIINLYPDFEIIVINDGSTDYTGTAAKDAGAIVFSHPFNLGNGAAIKSGIRIASGDILVFMDGDGQHDPKDIEKMLIYFPEYDMVVGARTGEKVHIPFFRRPAKWFLTRLAGFLVGSRIPDLNSGLRIFRKNLCLEFSHLYPEGFSFTSTLTMAFLTHKYSVKFIPINYYKREGKSSMRAYDFVNFNKLFVRLTLFFNPIKLFSLISGLLFLLAIFVFSFSKFYLKRVMDISTIVILMSSLQVFLFGLLAELIVRLREQK